MLHVAAVVAAVCIARIVLGGAVGDDHVVAISGLQHGGQCVSRLGVEDLGGVRVVGGDDHQRVREIHVLHGVGNGLVEVVGLADLAAGIACVVLLIDRGALDLQEEAVLLAVRVVIQQIERLLGHVLERGALIAEPVGVRGAHGRVGVLGRILGGGLGRVELGRHVTVAHQGEHWLAVLVLQGVHRGRIVLDGLEAHFLGLFPHGLALVFTTLHGLTEVLGTTADGYVGAGVEQLLGDGADAAVFLKLVDEALLGGIVGRAVGLALWAVAGTFGRMRFQHGRGGILDFGGGHIAGGFAGRLGQLEEVQLRIAVNINVNGVVVGLGAGGPCGTGCGGIGYGGKLARIGVGDQLAVAILADGAVLAAVADGEGRVLTGAGLHVAERAGLADRVETVEVAVGALQVVAGDGDFRIAHAVAEEQDDVLRVLVADGGDALRAAMLGEFRDRLAIGAVGGISCERRCGERAERCDGGECCDRALQSFVLAHVSSFFHAVSSVPSNLPFRLRPLGNARFDHVFRLRGTFPRLHCLDLSIPLLTLCAASQRTPHYRRTADEHSSPYDDRNISTA